MNRTAYTLIRTELLEGLQTSEGAERERIELALEELDRLMDVRYAVRRKKAGGKKKTKKKTAKKKSKKKTAKKKTKKKTTKKAGGRKKKTSSGGGTVRVRRGRRGRPGGTVIQAMRDAIRAQSGQFTVADVKAKMPTAMTRNTKPAVFSTTLKRLEDLGEIKVVKRGRGRRATTYKK